MRVLGKISVPKIVYLFFLGLRSRFSGLDRRDITGNLFSILAKPSHENRIELSQLKWFSTRFGHGPTL